MKSLKIKILILFGMFCILGGIFSTISTIKFQKDAIETTAIIMDVKEYIRSDGETEYNVYLTYTANGKIYNENYTTSFIPGNRGDTKTIYYDKNNPNNIKTNISLNFEIIIAITGMLFLSNAMYMINKEREKKNLLETGDKIYAEFKEVVACKKIFSNINYSNIICTGKDCVTGEIRTFKSEKISSSALMLTKSIEIKNIKSFPVYINATNRKKYYVSLEELDKI